MKKIKFLVLTALFVSISAISNGDESLGSECVVSSDPDLNKGSCWKKVDGSGDFCVDTDGTPRCNHDHHDN
jgi:hypothetical protein